MKPGKPQSPFLLSVRLALRLSELSVCSQRVLSLSPFSRLVRWGSDGTGLCIRHEGLSDPEPCGHSSSFRVHGPWPGALVLRPAPAGTRVPTGPLPPCLGAWLSFLFPEAFYPSLNRHPDLALLPLFLGFLGLVGGRQTEATKI